MSWTTLEAAARALLHAAVTPVAGAVWLGLVAALVTRWYRHPAVAHGLWLAVLVRFLVPAALALPILPAHLVPSWAVPSWTVSSAPTHEDLDHAAALQPARDPSSLAATRAASEPQPVATRDAVTTMATNQWPLATTVLAFWLAGSLVAAGIARTRGRRARGWLREASEASPALVARLNRLAERAGLRRVPALRVVDGPVPAHIAFERLRPVLVLPEALLTSLDRASLDAVLVHELAHLRRRDPWVRPLELLVGIVYWWHPVTWWARRNLRRAEELACDIWVAHTLPHRGRAYAEGLLTALELATNRSTTLPTTATAFAARDDLEERLHMIVNDNTPEPLSTPTRALAIALVVGGLLVVPTWRSSGDEAPVPTEEHVSSEDLEDALDEEAFDIDVGTDMDSTLEAEMAGAFEVLSERERAIEARMREMERAFVELVAEHEAIARAIGGRQAHEAATAEAAARRDAQRVRRDAELANAEQRRLVEHERRAYEGAREAEARAHERREEIERRAHEAAETHALRAEKLRAEHQERAEVRHERREVERLLDEARTARAAVEAEQRAFDALFRALRDAGIEEDEARAIIENGEHRRMIDGGRTRAEEALQRAEKMIEKASVETRPALEQARALLEEALALDARDD